MLNPLKAKLNLIRHPLALLGAYHIFHVSKLEVKQFPYSFSVIWRVKNM
jgi:hypothetical protein